MLKLQRTLVFLVLSFPFHLSLSLADSRPIEATPVQVNLLQPLTDQRRSLQENEFRSALEALLLGRPLEQNSPLRPTDLLIVLATSLTTQTGDGHTYLDQVLIEHDHLTSRLLQFKQFNEGNDIFLNSSVEKAMGRLLRLTSIWKLLNSSLKDTPHADAAQASIKLLAEESEKTVNMLSELSLPHLKHNEESLIQMTNMFINFWGVVLPPKESSPDAIRFIDSLAEKASAQITSAFKVARNYDYFPRQHRHVSSDYGLFDWAVIGAASSYFITVLGHTDLLPALIAFEARYLKMPDPWISLMDWMMNYVRLVDFRSLGDIFFNSALYGHVIGTGIVGFMNKYRAEQERQRFENAVTKAELMRDRVDLEVVHQHLEPFFKMRRVMLGRIGESLPVCEETLLPLDGPQNN